MKSKEPKIVEYELKTKKPGPADEWWAGQSEEGKTIARAVGRLIESLKKEAIIQIREARASGRPVGVVFRGHHVPGPLMDFAVGVQAGW